MGKSGKITIAYSSDGDWEGLYGIDGVLFHQGMFIRNHHIANYINGTGDSINKIDFVEVENDWLYLNGGLPQLLQDIPSDVIL
jgi:multimeric flavodoxin WrbA